MNNLREKAKNKIYTKNKLKKSFKHTIKTEQKVIYFYYVHIAFVMAWAWKFIINSKLKNEENFDFKEMKLHLLWIKFDLRLDFTLKTLCTREGGGITIV